MMNFKLVLCLISVALPVFLTQTNLQAANSGAVDIVLNKKVLDDQDLKIIDDYLRNAVDALLSVNDLSTISRYREAIAARTGTQGQYILQFNESVGKYLPEAFNKAKILKPDRRRTIVLTNLLILVNALKNVQLAPLALGNLDDNNVIIRYWAVQCLANPEIIKQLNAKQVPSNPNLPVEIAQKFKNMVAKSDPELLRLMAGYAAAIEIPQGEELLLQIADQRIKSYADWTVTYEYMDANILKLLESKISSPSDKADVPALAQRFAQLYSYVIQRYNLGGDRLSEDETRQLITVIAEVEDKCIKNMVGAQQTLRKAIEKKQMSTLMDEHDKLLGSATTQGMLPVKYHFNYGRTEAGTTRTSPVTLSLPPLT